jgi:hypothetical protein
MNEHGKATPILHKNLHIHGWPMAIMEAEYKIREYRLNIAKLKAAIQTFQEQIKPLAGLCISFAEDPGPD